MAYNLRSRYLREQLLEDDLDEETMEDNSADHLSSSENSSDDSYEESDNNMDIDMEEPSENQRLNQSRSEPQRGRPPKHLFGKDGFKWTKKTPSRRSDRHSQPIQPGPAGNAVNAKTLEDMWECLFTDEMINLIVHNTNLKIKEESLALVVEEKQQSYHHHTDAIEIRAYIGVLYYSGLWKSADVDVNRLWSKANGLTVYKCVFSRHRFTFLSTCLRFDNKDEREEDDRFAPIRNLWNMFIENCKSNYSPSHECTVDEQLLSFRGRCKFRVYMKDKPDKYGLKVISLNDAQTSYMINAVPYLGKNTEIVEGDEKIPEYYFRLVTVPIYDTNRSVTCDNWYTSIPLLQRMYSEPYNLRITGTIRKNKREIPADFIAKVPKNDRPLTKFCHAENLTLLSYAPKKKKSDKIVLVASSLLHTEEVTEDKPNIVLYYNKNKGGTDTFDKLCHSFSVRKKTYRWPQRFFQGILDMAIVNARILRALTAVQNQEQTAITAHYCLEKIYLHLITPHLERRLTQFRLPRDLKVGINTILNRPVLSERNLQNLNFVIKRRCALCDRKKDKKTDKGCASCKRPMYMRRP